MVEGLPSSSLFRPQSAGASAAQWTFLNDPASRPQTCPLPEQLGASLNLGSLSSGRHHAPVSSSRGRQPAGGKLPRGLISLAGSETRWAGSSSGSRGRRLEGGGGGLVVEGAQAGSEVVVQPTQYRTPLESERRGSAGRKRSDSNDGNPLLDMLERDRKERLRAAQTLRKLEDEVKRLKEQLADRDATISKLNEDIKASSERQEKVGSENDAETDKMRLAYQAACRETDTVMGRSYQQQADFDVLRSSADNERNRLRVRELNLKQQVREMEGKAENLNDQLETVERKRSQKVIDQSSGDRHFNELLRQLQSEADSERSKVAMLEREIKADASREIKLEAEILGSRERIRQYHCYIQRISQPQFSVVKDGNLTPVNPHGFNVVEGHVLVPVSLLAEGTTFLPKQS